MIEILTLLSYGWMEHNFAWFIHSFNKCALTVCWLCIRRVDIQCLRCSKAPILRLEGKNTEGGNSFSGRFAVCLQFIHLFIIYPLTGLSNIFCSHSSCWGFTQAQYACVWHVCIHSLIHSLSNNNYSPTRCHSPSSLWDVDGERETVLKDFEWHA